MLLSGVQVVRYIGAVELLLSEGGSPEVIQGIVRCEAIHEGHHLKVKVIHGLVHQRMYFREEVGGSKFQVDVGHVCQRARVEPATEAP